MPDSSLNIRVIAIRDFETEADAVRFVNGDGGPVRGDYVLQDDPAEADLDTGLVVEDDVDEEGSEWVSTTTEPTTTTTPEPTTTTTPSPATTIDPRVA